jgi:hypothetical protein
MAKRVEKARVFAATRRYSAKLQEGIFEPWPQAAVGPGRAGSNLLVLTRTRDGIRALRPASSRRR